LSIPFALYLSNDFPSCARQSTCKRVFCICKSRGTTFQPLPFTNCHRPGADISAESFLSLCLLSLCLEARYWKEYRRIAHGKAVCGEVCEFWFLYQTPSPLKEWT
jgi:hypothetical protein